MNKNIVKDFQSRYHHYHHCQSPDIRPPGLTARDDEDPRVGHDPD